MVHVQCPCYLCICWWLMGVFPKPPEHDHQVAVYLHSLPHPILFTSSFSSLTLWVDSWGNAIFKTIPLNQKCFVIERRRKRQRARVSLKTDISSLAERCCWSHTLKRSCTLWICSSFFSAITMPGSFVEPDKRLLLEQKKMCFSFPCNM